MFRKTLLIAFIAFALLGTVRLIAQEKGSEDKTGKATLVFDQWLKELSEAHSKKNSEKVGQLIDEMMKDRRKWMKSAARTAGAGQPALRKRNWALAEKGGQAPEGRLSALKREEEKKILQVLDEMRQNERRGMMNIPLEDGKLLRLLTEAVHARHVVEIGTSNGYSGIWICLALRATGGRLVTYEIDTPRADLARKNFERAGVSNILTLVMGDAHETVKKIKEPIDILFLDADKAGYIDYLNKLLPLVRRGGLIMAHNTSSHGRDQGMQDFIKAVTTNPDLDTIFLHEQGAGMSVTLKMR